MAAQRGKRPRHLLGQRRLLTLHGPVHLTPQLVAILETVSTQLREPILEARQDAITVYVGNYSSHIP